MTNLYLVYGRRYVDMCGTSEDILLGVIELERRDEVFRSKRLYTTGHYHYNDQIYYEYIFVKTRNLNKSQPTDFRKPKHGNVL